MPAKSKQELKEAFDRIDVDRSGCIDIGELQELLVLLDIPPNNVTLWKMMEKLDTTIPYGQVDFDEFCDYMLSGHSFDESLGRTPSIPEAGDWGSRLDTLSVEKETTAVRHDVQGSVALTEDQVISRYPLGKKLGAGKYASVHKCLDKETNMTKAMKIFYKKNRSKKKFYDVIEEANKMRRVQDHPHIVKCYDLIETQERLIMLIEFVEGGQLYDEILHRKPSFFSEQIAGKIIGQLTSALAHMHANGVIHCDLKPENVLCTGNPAKNDEFDIKVADMGLSKIIEVDMKQSLTYCGTPLYMAPEMIKKESYSYPVDMWSVGCMMHELMCGDPPFTGKNFPDLERNVKSFDGLHGKETIATKLIKNKFIKYKVSPTAQDLIGKFLTPDAKLRITAEDALKHAWIADNEALSKEHLGAVHVNLKIATERRKFRRTVNKIVIAQKIMMSMKNAGASHSAPKKGHPSEPKKKKESEDTGCNCSMM